MEQTTHTLDKEKMDAIRAIADANLKVSEAKNALLAVKNDEAKYIKEREAITRSSIEKILEESKAILDGAYANYAEVKALQKDVLELASWIIDGQKSFSSMLADFEKMSSEFSAYMEEKEKDIASKRTEIMADKIRIANDRQGVEDARKRLEIDRRKVEDSRGVVERQIIRLKQGKI